jgi:pimeloyl-ACP methyl ester carboxylesterase
MAREYAANKKASEVSVPTVVAVHGIAQQNKGPEVLTAEWGPPLRDGVGQSGVKLGERDLVCAFYGRLFRPAGSVRAVGDPNYRASDVTDDEAELLHLFWQEAARIEPARVPAPDAAIRTATPGSVQVALRVLARSRFFAGLAERAFIGALKQVRRYLKETEIRAAARKAVDAAVDKDTRVLVAHSLGTVVTYEALHEYGGAPRWANVRTLVTLGSPLGIPNLIFDALEPAPNAGRGAWPPRIERWTNISDDGDVVALTKKLGPLFGDALVDIRIVNGATAHDVMPYLTSAETGKAIADGLA